MATEKSRVEAEFTNANTNEDERNLRAMLASPESFSREFLIENEYPPTLIDKVAKELNLKSHMASGDAKQSAETTNRNNAKISPSSRERNKHPDESSINSKSNAKGKENTVKPKSPISSSPVHAAADAKTLLDTQTRLAALAVPLPLPTAAPTVSSPRGNGGGWLPSFLSWNTASASVSVSTVASSTTTSTSIPAFTHSHHFAGSGSSSTATTPGTSPRPMFPSDLKIDQQSSQSNSDEETSLADAYGNFAKVKMSRVVSQMKQTTNEGKSTDSSLSNTPRLATQTAAAAKK